MAESSWHVPTVSKHQVTNPLAELNVVYLQRMTELDQKQVEQALSSVDNDAVQDLNIIGPPPAPRPLRVKKWIRDSEPSSVATLEIARLAYRQGYSGEVSVRSLVFVDSAWDLGDVIVARWEKREEDAEPRLSAARASAGIANVLLTACDGDEEMTLSRALGPERFKQRQVDFYQDLNEPPAPAISPETPWPNHLPKDLKLSNTRAEIISLRKLDSEAIQKFKDDMKTGSDGDIVDVQVYDWEGPEPTDRLVLRDLYNQILQRSEKRETSLYAWFIDYLLRGPDGGPQRLAVSPILRDPGNGVEVLPVFASCFSRAWDKAANGGYLDEEAELVDIWKKELVDHYNTANPSKSARTLG